MFGQNAPPFYSVLGSSGSSPTPPINYIGATPQLNFATILNTGGFLGNSPATGTVLADGVSYDGAAWTAKDTGAVALQMNGALPGIILYANSGLTPGVVYGPTAALTWLGPGNPWTFTDKIDVASLPAADAANAGILTASVQLVGGRKRFINAGNTTAIGNSRNIDIEDLNGAAGNRVEIGWGWRDATFAPVTTGWRNESAAGHTKGSWYVATRAVTTDTAPIERLTVDSNGNTLFSVSIQVGSSGTPITQAKVYSQTITPASVAANTTAVQTFTVTGLTTADKVNLNHGAAQTAGIGIVGVRVSAADTLEITFANNTAGALTPVSSTCQILATRS